MGPGCSGLGFIWRKTSVWTTSELHRLGDSDSCHCPSEPRAPGRLSEAQGTGTWLLPQPCSLPLENHTGLSILCQLGSLPFFGPRTHHPGHRVNDACHTRASLYKLPLQTMSPAPIKGHQTQEQKKCWRTLAPSRRASPPTAFTFFRSQFFPAAPGPLRRLFPLPEYSCSELPRILSGLKLCPLEASRLPSSLVHVLPCS